MELNNQLQQIFEGQKPSRKTSVNVDVELAPSDLLYHLAKCYHLEIQRLNTSQVNLINELSVDDVFKYFNTLIYMRVGRINHELSPEFNKVYRRVVVPTMVYQLARAIGEVFDSEYGIRMFPGYTVKSDEILSVDSMLDISDRLKMLQTNGLSQVDGLPNESDGDLDFMVMNYVDGDIFSYRRSHPTFGFLSAFFKRRMSQEITLGMTRIFYGDVETYKASLMNVITALDSGSHD